MNATAHTVGSPEWVEARRHTLGASEVATALGLVPDSDAYSKPIDVWLEKTGAERVTPINVGRTSAGNRFEAVVRDWYAELAGKRVTPWRTLVHPEHSWMSCTPDSLVMGSSIKGPIPVRNVQIKLVGARPSFAWPGQQSVQDDGSLLLNPPDGIPDYYRVQVEWEMEILRAVYGIEETHLVALLGGTELRVYEVPRDPALFAALFESAKRFWFQHVVADVPPPPDGSEAFKRFLERRYPRVERAELEPITPEVAGIADRYVRARELGKKAKAAQDRAGNELRAALGSSLGMWGEGLKVQWKETKSGRSLDVREV